jgi:NADH-quinone oxidoreductase subunit M
LAGVLLKTAGYGLLRFGVPLFPNASLEFAPIAMWLGVIGIFYGAVMACAQTDIKRLIAYTSVSHMGFVLIGIYSGNMVALQGVVIQMLAHGLSAGALFILCGEIYERLHTRDMREMGGLWTRLRYLPPIALVFTAASLGLPGLGNFVGEIMVLLGAFQANPMIAVLASGGLVLAAIYGLLFMQKVFYGPIQSATPLPDLSARELSTLVLLAVLLVGLGVYPQPVLDTSVASMQFLNSVYSQSLLPTVPSAGWSAP